MPDPKEDLITLETPAPENPIEPEPTEPDPEPPAETPEEEVAEEPVEGEEPVTVDEEPDAPTVVQTYMPDLATKWTKLDPEVQRAVLSSLARAIDQGEPDAADGEPAKPGGAQEPAPAAPSKPVAPPTARPNKAFAGITEDEVKAALEYDPDSPVSKLLEKVVGALGYAIQGTDFVIDKTLAAIDETRSSVTSIAEEREFEKALDAHARELSRLNRRDYFQVVDEARKMKDTKRVKDYSDAVSLALLHRDNVRPTGAKPPGKARADAERLAASLVSRGRGGKRIPRLSGPLTIKGIAEHYERYRQA